MRFYNVSEQDLILALKYTNIHFDDNVIFNRFELVGKIWNATLRVKSSKGKGHLHGYILTSKGNNKSLISFCWHGHGHYIDWVQFINPSAIIKTAVSTIKTVNGVVYGNWEDKQVGSRMYPIMYSERCDCELFPPSPREIENPEGIKGKIEWV